MSFFNQHNLYRLTPPGAPAFNRMMKLLGDHGKLPARDDRAIAETRDWLWRMGPSVSNPLRVVRDWEHAERLISGTVPPIGPVVLGNWMENGWYPEFAYAKWMYPFFTLTRRRNIFAWNLSRNFNCIISNATAADKWSTPQVTPKFFRWWMDPQPENRDFMLASLIETREAGLFPILTVFEHTDIPMDDDRAIQIAQQTVDLTHKWVPLYLLCWELDERLPSRERWRFEKMMCREVNWRGRDLGNHYARPTEGSGVDVYTGLREAWIEGGNHRNGGNVVRLYQSNRNADRPTLKIQGRQIGDVARRTNTCCAAFEHSGSDPRIGNTYTEQESNERATIVYREILDALDGDTRRCGSMNGAVAA